MSSPNTAKQPDPILTHSLSWPLAIMALLLMASTLWAMYDEFFGKRPWAEYQAKYVEVYGQYLDSIKETRASAFAKITSREDYQALTAQLTAEEAKNKSELDSLAAELAHLVQPQIEDLTKAMVEPRSKITAQIYLIEHAGAVGATEQKAALQKELQELESAVNEFEVRQVPLTNPVVIKLEKMDYATLGRALQAAKDRKTEILAEQGRLNSTAGILRKKMLGIVDLYKTGLTPTEVTSLRNDLENFKIEIKQIHVKDVDLVDRCESCHVGIRQPVDMTYEKLLPIVGEGNEMYAKAFAVHPKDKSELLKIHDPERFGCSPCHGGNGVGTTTIEKAHGKNHHWLWPMYDKENTEAGCLQCHQSELKLDHAGTLNAGKELFRHLGCWGCHPREGFDSQKTDLLQVTQNLKALEEQRKQLQKAVELNTAKQDDENTPAEAIPALIDESNQTTLRISALTAQERELKQEQAGLYKEMKMVGPNLKNVKAKLNRDWLPVWVSNTKDFRPMTRMPQFRFENEDVKKDIAAFIWQSGQAVNAPKQPAGDAGTGKTLFEQRGCMACHSVGAGDSRLGGPFAADLSRVGEKANYDYLVHWVQHPEKRLVPYNALEKRDYTAAEAQALAADDPAWHQAAIMPNLRLSDAEARNIASYLMTLKQDGVTYEKADYMEDTSRFKRGKDWVKHFGCAGCHEIAGLERENGIGTELTEEGSKPIERLDFGLLTQAAEVGRTFEGDPFAAEFADGKEHDWYNHKGFFKRKLKQPEIFDKGKEDTKQPLERLKMPNFRLSDEEIVQLTTFMLGSVESNLPKRFYSNPQGAAKDIADGWWVVQKYNCSGCHQFVPGEKPLIQKLPWFDKLQNGVPGNAPPNLVGEGARVDPQWLATFLRNPALSNERLHRNGLRQYLQIRMPTFSLSEREIQTLVRFFDALSKQPTPYVREQTTPLSEAHKKIARGVLRNECVRCHASEDLEVYPKEVIAPNLGFAEARLKPSWIERWVVQPSAIFPGTAMPDGLFKYNAEERRFTITSTVDGLDSYPGDHRDLVVRYLMELTPAEAELLKNGQ